MAKKKILAIWLDYDRCFYDGNVRTVEGTREAYKKSNEQWKMRYHELLFKGAIVDHVEQAIKELKPDEVQIASFSNRQNAYIDNLNSRMKVTHSSFNVYQEFTRFLQEKFPTITVKTNKFLLADTYMQAPRVGAAWDTAHHFFNMHDRNLTDDELERCLPPLNIRVKAHEFKMDLFYCKAHQACQDKNSIVHAMVYDDLEAVLESNYKLYKENPDLLPKNFSADLFAYTALSGTEKKSGLSSRDHYLQQSPLRSIGAESGALHSSEASKIPLERLDVYPGADTNKPEHYPYHGFDGETYFNKKGLAINYFQLKRQDHAYISGILRCSASYNDQYRLQGTGSALSYGHTLNYRLKESMSKLPNQELAEYWVRCNGAQPGSQHGLWAGDETLHDKFIKVARSLGGIVWPRALSPRSPSPVASETYWHELFHYRYQ